MRNSTLFFFSLALFGFINTDLYGFQDSETPKLYLSADSLKSKPPKRTQILFGELLGVGLQISANYDFRFAKQNNGLGARIGIGAPFGVTIPLEVNYLFGAKNHLLDIGGGATAYIRTGEFLQLFKEGRIIPTLSVSYRYQPINQPLVLKVGLTKLLIENKNDYVDFTIFPNLGLGIKF